MALPRGTAAGFPPGLPRLSGGIAYYSCSACFAFGWWHYGW